jgi:hypothetical protein
MSGGAASGLAFKLWRSAMGRLACVFVLAAAVTTTAAGCGVEVGSGYGYGGDYPPDAYIATTEPYYFDGRPTYWYGDHWYYRDGGRWSHYDREPPALYQRRMQGAPVRRNYEGGWRGAPPAPAGPGRPGPVRRAPSRGGWRGHR